MGPLNMDGCERFADKDYTLLGQLRGGWQVAEAEVALIAACTGIVAAGMGFGIGIEECRRAVG